MFSSADPVMAMKDAIAASASSSSDDGTTSNETIVQSSQLSVTLQFVS